MNWKRIVSVSIVVSTVVYPLFFLVDWLVLGIVNEIIDTDAFWMVVWLLSNLICFSFVWAFCVLCTAINRKQRIVLRVATVVIVLMLIFPPILPDIEITTVFGPQLQISDKPETQYYGLITELEYCRIRYEVLAIQYAFVAFTVLGLILTFKDKSKQMVKLEKKVLQINKEQRIVIWVGVGLLVLAVCYVPWTYQPSLDSRMDEYRFIFNPPFNPPVEFRRFSSFAWEWLINIPLWLGPMIGVIFLTTTFIYTLRDKTIKDEQKE